MTETNVHRLPLRKTAMALIRELGSESNAHGVARIIRTRDNRRKVAWSLLVLFGVGSAISQLSSLVHKYLQYQVVEVSEIQDGLPVEFPSVTVCNIEPISWRKLRLLLNGTTANTSEVRAWLQFLETFDFGEQQAHLRSIRAFHENVEEGVLHVRHSLNESLLHCSFNKQPCSTTNFTTSFDGNYYNCFTFNAQAAEAAGEEERGRRLIVHSTGPEHGLSVVMFLDNNIPPLGSYGVYTLDTNILHSAGARVMVHAPNTLPIPVDHGQDVAPGYSTSVAIKPFLHARLAYPYSNCSDTHLRGLSSFTSTYSTCIAVCKQELIVSKCGCRSSALPQVPSLMHVPYCGHVPHWRRMLRHIQAFNRSQHLPKLLCELRALERLKNDRRYEAECGCTHPCGELSYHMSTSMSYWPTELYQYHALKQLYGDHILQSPLSRAFKLHDSNIKDGEKLMQQLSRYGQSGSNATASGDEDEQSEASPETKGKDGGSLENSFPDDTRSQGSETGDSSAPNSKDRDAPTQSSKTLDSSIKSESHVSVEKCSSDSRNHLFDSQQNRTESNSSYRAQNRAPKETPDNKRKGAGVKEQQQQPPLEYNNQQLDNLQEASTDIRQNLLRLNVYLEDLSVVKYKQVPAYGMEDLFADIGGTLGLWMGMSVLTIMELLELIIRLSHLLLRAEWRPSEPCSSEDNYKNTKNTDQKGGGDRELNTYRRDFSDHDPDRHYRGQMIRGSRDRDWKARDPSPFLEFYTDQSDDITHADTESENITCANSKRYSYRSES